MNSTLAGSFEEKLPGCDFSDPLAASRTPPIGLRSGGRIAAEQFARLKQRLVLQGCKWDPQVGDVATLADFPLLLEVNTWGQLAAAAEALSAEVTAAEAETMENPHLLKRLGFPRTLRRALESTAGPPSPAAARVMRFDFHPTPEGWRISEVNCDVPGGFTEASFFTELMVDAVPGTRATGHPADALTDALVHLTGTGAAIALLSAPGYMEDHQVIAYVGSLLARKGCEVHLANPLQLRWREGIAHLEAAWHTGPMDAVWRFFQVEWLIRLNSACGWERFFTGGHTPTVHPGVAAIAESKRFPLIWNHLSSPMSAWESYLPQTLELRDSNWRRDGWVIKSAMCNTGDEVGMPDLLPASNWKKLTWHARLNPSRWVAQQRFDSEPVQTPDGLRHICLGIYTINGIAAGVYGRISPKPLIDYSAVDVCVLIPDHD